MFLLGTTWLALHVWASEHGLLLLAAAPALLQPRVRSRGRGAAHPTSTVTT